MGIEVIERIGRSKHGLTKGARYAVEEEARGRLIVRDDNGRKYRPYLGGIDCQRGIIKNHYWRVSRFTDDTPGPEAPAPTENEPEVEGCFWIKRTGPSGGIFTKGRRYYVYEDGRFRDDSCTWRKYSESDKTYWERVSAPAAPPTMPAPDPTRIEMESSKGVEPVKHHITWDLDPAKQAEIERLSGAGFEHRRPSNTWDLNRETLGAVRREELTDNFMSAYFDGQFTTTKEENKTMSIRIKQATLINGADADNFDTEQLLRIIRGEEASIKRLEEFTAKSKAITNLIAKHEANVIALIGILDAREEPSTAGPINPAPPSPVIPPRS